MPQSFNWISILILFSALQGFLLAFAIHQIKNRNKKANQTLGFFILLVSATLAGRVFFDEYSVKYPKLFMATDVVIYLFGVLLYIYIRQLLIVPTNKSNYQIKLMLTLPSLIYLSANIPYFLIENKELIQMIFVTKDKGLYRMWNITGIFCLVINFYYLIRSYRLIYNYKIKIQHQNSYPEKLSYLTAILVLMTICMALWAYMFGDLFGFKNYLIFLNFNSIWIVLSLLTYLLGFFAISQPELFRIPLSAPPKPKFFDHTKEEKLLELKTKLIYLMETKKPYLDPKLSLGELAELSNIDKLTLSKVIHEGFQKNFYDFINAYRVDEFIQLTQQDTYKSYTFLALAYEVGFHSKTTFNKVFKKMKNKTPREYLRILKEPETNIK